MKKHRNNSTLKLRTEWLSIYAPILCVTLTVILLAACSAPAPDPEPEDDNSAQTSGKQNSANQNTANQVIDRVITIEPASVSTINIAVEERSDTDAASPSRRNSNDANKQVRNEVALLSEIAGGSTASAVVSQASSYRHRTADQLIPYHGPSVDRENYLTVVEN